MNSYNSFQSRYGDGVIFHPKDVYTIGTEMHGKVYSDNYDEFKSHHELPPKDSEFAIYAIIIGFVILLLFVAIILQTRNYLPSY